MTSATLVPGYEQVIELPREWGPSPVPEAFRDENGHMNVKHYFDVCVEAAGVVFERIGIDETYRTERGMGLFTLEHHIRYYSETRVGEQISVHLRGIERSDKIVHLIALLVNDTTQRLSCTLEILGIQVDLHTRKPAPFDADIASAIDRELAAPAVDWPAPLCGAMGIRR